MGTHENMENMGKLWENWWENMFGKLFSALKWTQVEDSWSEFSLLRHTQIEPSKNGDFQVWNSAFQNLFFDWTTPCAGARSENAVC